MRGCEKVPGEAGLTLGLQMRETSNPKHGCAAELHASVHCHLAGKLTDDDLTFLLYFPLSSSFLLFSILPLLPSQWLWHTSPPSLQKTEGKKKKITETQNQIIHGAPLLNMWLTHWEPLWEIRLKNELFIRTRKASPIGCREWKNTPTIYPKQHYKLDHDTCYCSYSFLSSSQMLPFTFWYWNTTLGKIAW